jgi:hypothetical protein
VCAGCPSAKVSAVLAQLHPEGINAFKDAYMLEYLTKIRRPYKNVKVSALLRQMPRTHNLVYFKLKHVTAKV